jgi:hypothetical protein
MCAPGSRMSNSPDREGEKAAAERIAGIRRLTRLMDEAVKIPGLGIRVGIDPLLGLIPGIGDVAGAAVGGWIIVSAARLGASRAVLVRMLANLGLDALVGAVPFLGDLFDFAFKAHRRNLRLLEAHIADPLETRRRSRRLIGFAVGGVTVLILSLVALVGWVLAAALRALGG